MGKICDWYRDNSCDCFCNGLDISCENYHGDLCANITFTAFVYEGDGVTSADLSTYDTKEDAIEFAKARNWDEVVNDITGEVVWKRSK